MVSSAEAAGMAELRRGVPSSVAGITLSSADELAVLVLGVLPSLILRICKRPASDEA